MSSRGERAYDDAMLTRTSMRALVVATLLAGTLTGLGLARAATPTVTQQAVVGPILALTNTDLMKSSLPTLTQFNNRYYRSSTGAQAGEWLFGKVKDVVAANNASKLSVMVTQFKHDWGQHSIIARIEGMNNNNETIILGAHMDSINSNIPMNGRAPGADDAGSSVVALLEVMRVLLKAGYKPLRPIEFHWYSGTEAGLLGSRAIASAYKKNGRVVVGMLNFPSVMVPNKKAPDVGLLTDYTNATLNTFMRQLATTYTALPMHDFTCGYGCTDQASWNEFGYHAVATHESSIYGGNPFIHTEKDDLTTIDYDHALHFVKLGVAFAVELGHP